LIGKFGWLENGVGLIELTDDGVRLTEDITADAAWLITVASFDLTATLALLNLETVFSLKPQR